MKGLIRTLSILERLRQSEFRKPIVRHLALALMAAAATQFSLNCAASDLPKDAPLQLNSLSISEAWQRLQAANPSLSAARKEVERRIEEYKASANLRGPEIEVAGRYTFIDDPIVIDLNPIRQGILGLHPNVPAVALPPFSQTVQDDAFLKGQLNAALPFYTGGRVQAARMAAKAAVEQAQAESRSTADTLFGELVNRFYAAQLAHVASQTRAVALAGLEEHVRQARQLEKEGFIARASVLQAQVARDAALREAQRAKSQSEIARIALSGLLALDEPVVPASPLFLVEKPLPDLDTFLDNMRRNHPALQVVQARQDQAAQAVAAERGKLLPELYLFGRQELNKQDLTLFEPQWALGLGIRLKLWDREGVRQRISAARLLEERVELLEENALLGLRTLVEKSYREISQAREQFASLRSSLALAQENLSVQQAAFREGQGTSLDVVDAQIALAAVRAEQAAAAYDFEVALVALLEASGQPNEFFDYEADATERIYP